MIERLASTAAFGAFARGCTIAPPSGDPYQARVILRLAIESVDEYGRIVLDQDFADFLGAAPPVGSVMTVDGYDGRSWEIDRRTQDDREIARVIIRPQIGASS